MLLVPQPAASVLFLVRVSHQAVSMLAPVPERPHKYFAVVERFSAYSVHFSSLEFANICFLEVCVVVRAFASEQPVLKVPFVVAPIIPLVVPMTIFLPILKIAHISRVVDKPCLHSQSFLPIIFPLALVPVALRIEHDAEPFSSVVDPVTLVGIPLRVDESSETLLHS